MVHRHACTSALEIAVRGCRAAPPRAAAPRCAVGGRGGKVGRKALRSCLNASDLYVASHWVLPDQVTKEQLQKAGPLKHDDRGYAGSADANVKAVVFVFQVFSRDS